MYEYQVLCKCVRLSFSLCVYVLLDPLADFVYLKDIGPFIWRLVFS